MKLEQLIFYITDIVKSVEDKGASVDKKITKMVEETIDSFEVENKKIKKSKKNYQLINQLTMNLSELINGKNVSGLVKQSLSNIETIIDNNAAIQKMVSDEDIKSFVEKSLNETQKAYIASVSLSLTPITLESQMIVPIQQVLANSVATGKSLNETQKLFEDTFYEANKDVDKAKLGKMQRYFGQITKDAYLGYDGAIQDALTKEYGFDAYLYVGVLRDNSRAQCKKWTDMRIIRISELQKEIEWAYKNGSGMRKNTTPENFAENRGGFNCGHRAIAVSYENYKVFNDILNPA